MWVTYAITATKNNSHMGPIKNTYTYVYISPRISGTPPYQCMPRWYNPKLFFPYDTQSGFHVPWDSDFVSKKFDPPYILLLLFVEFDLLDHLRIITHLFFRWERERDKKIFYAIYWPDPYPCFRVWIDGLTDNGDF